MPRTNYTHLMTQAEIMSLRRDGMTIKAIARHCNVSERTVKKFSSDYRPKPPKNLVDAGAYVKTLFDQGYFDKPWTFKELQKELANAQLPLATFHLTGVLRELGFRKVWVHFPKEST